MKTWLKSTNHVMWKYHGMTEITELKAVIEALHTRLDKAESIISSKSATSAPRPEALVNTRTIGKPPSLEG